MTTHAEVVRILDEVLGLKGRGRSFTTETPLLGSVPELDSMAVLSIINALEESFGFTLDDDELSGATFATVGSLVQLVESVQGR